MVKSRHEHSYRSHRQQAQITFMLAAHWHLLGEGPGNSHPSGLDTKKFRPALLAVQGVFTLCEAFGDVGCCALCAAAWGGPLYHALLCVRH